MSNSDKSHIRIFPLTHKRFDEAVDLVLRAKLDSREEIVHHLQHIDAHYIALDGEEIVGVIGWYTVKAMGADKLYVSSVPQTRFYYQRQGFKLLMTGKISGHLKYFMVKDLISCKDHTFSGYSRSAVFPT